MAKLNRESRLRDRRALKAAKKDARKRASADGSVGTTDALTSDDAPHWPTT